MDKEDARNQTLAQLHERRKQVVRLHRKGHGVMRIVDLTGLSYPTVRKAIDL
jgi:DNA-binding NarL/FixJ family response regulator